MEELEQSDTDDDSETDDEEEFMDLEGDKLLQSLQRQGEQEQATIDKSHRCPPERLARFFNTPAQI